MERRIARAGGHRSDDEARTLNARIAKLTEILEGVNAEHAMLLEQVCSFARQTCHAALRMVRLPAVEIFSAS
jgi:hypothetical protein